MGPSNLHAYLMPEWRGRGIMSRVLHEVVLPVLATDARERQAVTFQDPGIQHFLERLGFTIESTPGIGGEGRASIELVAQASLAVAAEARPLSPERLEEVKKRIRVADQLLQMVADELEFALGNEAEVIEDLRDLAGNVSSKKWSIEDANWNAAGTRMPKLSP
jgi:hypothetical protein